MPGTWKKPDYYGIKTLAAGGETQCWALAVHDINKSNGQQLEGEIESIKVFWCFVFQWHRRTKLISNICRNIQSLHSIDAYFCMFPFYSKQFCSLIFSSDGTGMQFLL